MKITQSYSRSFIKRCFTCIVAFAMLFGTLALGGCNSNSNESSGKIVIWAFNYYIDTAKEMVKEYQKEHPNVEFEIVELGQDDLVEKFRIALASGNKDTLPDVIVEEYYNLKGYLEFYGNSFADITDYLDPTLYYDFTVQCVTYDNKIWGVPYDTGVGAWFYREDILREAGFTDADLQDITWDRFIEIGKVVKEKTGKYLIPIMPAGNIEGRVILQSTGSWYYDKEGNLDIEGNQALVDMTKTIKELTLSGVACEVASWDDIIASFYNGESAGVIGGGWWSYIIRENESQSGLWRMALPPRMTGSESYTNYSNCAGCCWIPLNKDNKKTAIDFLMSTVAVSDDIADTMARTQTVVPALKSGANTPSAMAGDAYFGNQPIVRIMAEWSEKVPYVNYSSHSYEIAYGHGDLFPDYIRGKTTIEEVISALQKKAETIISQ